MPTIRFLVVCGFGLTMEIFLPINLFNSVDLPTLGGPMIAMKPDKYSVFSLFFLSMHLFSIKFIAEPQRTQRKYILFSAERAEKRIDRMFPLSVLSTERGKTLRPLRLK